MPARRKSSKVFTDQLPLLLRDEAHVAATARGVFALHYLRRHLGGLVHAPGKEATDTLYAFARDLWQKNHIGLAKGPEAYTRTHFLDPLLTALGWQFIPELTQTTQKRPDYWLFTDETQRIAAAEAESPEHRFALSSTVLEAKQFTHPLDAVSKKESPGLFPSQQVQGYLHAARDGQGKRYFDWAILSNGRLWRLYTERAAEDSYFEFTLADEHSFCTREEFSFFVALFSPGAFIRGADGRCPLDDIQSESLSLQSVLEENLRRRIFDVLEELATAFADHKPNDITDEDLKSGALYEACLIFLYRLLFVLYAESRYLLPVRARPPGYNKNYKEKYSLQRLVDPLKAVTTKYNDDAFTDLYEDLLKLFRLIDGQDERLNAACDVTRYNGGLFAQDSPISCLISQWRIPDPALARVLRQLVFAQPPARGSSKQQLIFTEDSIDYSTLEVRQLGDIYEGLLGGELRRKGDVLVLTDQNGENHRHGIFYTPDWVVTYLVRTTLDPLLARIGESEEVKKAVNAKNKEERRTDAFAHGVLGLNLVDPAMGSGHFLVRSVEYLAACIFKHPTTRRKTERIVTSGEGKRLKADIEKEGRIAVAAGLSQEEAELAYWRRRVVEACIYGVDINPMAVELAKLSLWLTCIAIDEPLNFLDHHLRHGNSLLFARASEISQPPFPSPDLIPLQLTDVVEPALREVIRRYVDIEAEASTRMELVKNKERMWREARKSLAPLLRVADLWLGAVGRLPMPELDYLTLARLTLAPATMDEGELGRAKKLRDSINKKWDAVRDDLVPFHWEIEFPDVFLAADGSPLPPDSAGFDAILGNPPYVSTQTSSGQAWLATLQKRWGYSNDLYVFFTDLGFRLLRKGGRFGFIVSDTFFTLASKAPMRTILHRHQLDVLGQCDPFDATVDAALFVAEKNDPPPAHETLFVQARFRWREAGKRSEPDKALPLLPDQKLAWTEKTPLAGGASVSHERFRDLRLHRVPSTLWRDAHKAAFFEPRPGTLRLFERFNAPVKALHAEWWERIETSEKFAQNRADLAEYHSTLQPGDITLVGLIAEGGQGMRTANNARFLGYLEGTPQAANLLAKRAVWTLRWLADAEVAERFHTLLEAAGGDPGKPTKDSAAWEATVEPLRAEFSAARLGFGKTDLYRMVPKSLVAGPADFEFAWKERKKELWQRWRSRGELKGFWGVKNPATRVTDADFCEACIALQSWVLAENEQRRMAGKKRLPKDVLGLRSAENYDDPKDAIRIATIYNGLRGRGQWVPFRKGDPEGNRWVDNEPLFVQWTSTNVDWLSTAAEARWQGHRYFFRPGLTYNIHARGVLLKSKLLEDCVFDASASMLMPCTELVPPRYLLVLLNSHVVSFYIKKFCNNTWHELSDLRQLPLVIPTPAQAKRLERLAELAMQAKRHAFAAEPPSDPLVFECRRLADALSANAPTYLRPPAQAVTFQKPDDCLAVIERTVNWEAEKLYGVESLGPFDDF